MKLRTFVISLLFMMPFWSLFAGPTIIRDSRITDTALTPVLGRGYSIGTNTFQSTCMEKVVITEPSYDLIYSFDSIESETSTSSTDTTTDTTAGSTTTSRSGSSSRKSKYWIFNRNTSSAYKNVLKTAYKTANSSRIVNNTREYSHVILVNIKLNTYYASVDESQTKLGDSATELLKNKDIPGFFASCGPYYVRSIGREAIMTSTFTYTSTDSERDEAFENMIENQIKGFRSHSSKRNLKVFATNITGEDRTAVRTDSTTMNQTTNEFNEKASEKKLTITTHAFGLGKRKDAKIISYDIDSFKEAIQEAFVSMQNARTGKVINMEVVPWVENTEFQNLIELEKSEKRYEDILDADGNQELDENGNPRQRELPRLLLYEKKMLLNENAEFIIEIDRVDRNIINMYYKARLCRRNIDMNWKVGDQLKTYPDGTPIIIQNKRFLDQTMPLSELDQLVSAERVKELYDLHKRFMYGEGADDKGAAECMKTIMKEGIFKKSYREIEDCQPAIENMGEIQNDMIENYCMPEPAE